MEESLLQVYFKKDGASTFSLYSNNFKGGHTQTINDVAWAPLAGRSYHLIASCSKDGLIIVWKFTCRDILNATDSDMLKIPNIE